MLRGVSTPIETLTIDAGGVDLYGDLACPSGAARLVIFAHGSGSGRHSPRNRSVAAALSGRGCATLLLDLLTPEEEADEAMGGRLRFDVERLGRRLAAVTEWVRRRPQTGPLAVGYFGASTGAAAAIIAAAAAPQAIGAVVSRGGRPDLAGQTLGALRAPVLLIVGGADVEVLRLNEMAMRQISAPCELQVVPGATHLFEEPGALEAVAALAADWFEAHLRPH